MNSNSKLNITNGVIYITFDRLSELGYVKHAFSTKIGGVSNNEFKSMNLSFNRGDDEKLVRENFARFFDASGLTLENIVMSDQVHGTDIYCVKKRELSHFDKDLINRKVEKIDGLITRVKNVPLVTFYADCVPIYFVDTKKKAIGLSHSGWRGTVNSMAIKTLEAMKKSYSTKPRDVIAVIGPSICRKCYEVSSDVIDELTKNLGDKINVKDAYDKKDNGRYQLDLWLINKMLLMSAGVLEENIVIADLCTSCNSELLFSHRVTNGKRGNLIAALELI